MTQIIIMFTIALALSSAAAYYSIAGLTAIFSSSVIPIIIMGSILEVAKLSVASWVYHNWTDAPKLLKSYFVMSLVVLMTITSVGTFGYLSKAHTQQAVPTGEVVSKLEAIDYNIKLEQTNIENSRATLSQLDEQVNQTIKRTEKQENANGINRSIRIRKAQAKEREELKLEIANSQSKIKSLNAERAPIASELRQVEADVGPIKYISALIYGVEDTSNLESSVRILIIMIVSVFDPLAVLMLIAANWSLNKYRKPKDIPAEDEKVDWTEFFIEGVQEDTMKDFNDETLMTDEVIIQKELIQTIEKEVEENQSIGVSSKTIEYDSLGRRTTP